MPKRKKTPTTKPEKKKKKGLKCLRIKPRNDPVSLRHVARTGKSYNPHSAFLHAPEHLCYKGHRRYAEYVQSRIKVEARRILFEAGKGTAE